MESKMKTYVITPVIDNIRKTVEAHKLAPGSYARWLWQDGAGLRSLGENPYGCADAANLLYSIGEFPRSAQEREASVAVLQSMQGEGGLFHEATHHPLHTTAHCAAALDLFDAAPLHPCTALSPWRSPAAIPDFLGALAWEKNPWSESHKGAGLYAILNFCGMADVDWNAAYFRWLWDNTDVHTGFFCAKGKENYEAVPKYVYMAGAFHYLFNYEAAHMPLRCPEEMIDSCLAMYSDPKGLPETFGTRADFLEIDWIFCLTRASRQTPHRFRDVQACLASFAETYLSFWFDADWERDESLHDLHTLFGGVCALCELQSALRGHLLSEKPLRLVLDRRPFI